MPSHKQTKILIPLAILLTLAVPPLGSNRIAAQQDTTEFIQAFEIFQQQKDTLRTFDLSAEEMVIPLPETYRLGPGDVLQVILTGMINDALPVQIGPQGDIYVPPAGLLKVEGMTVAEARDFIDTSLSKYLINYDLAVQLSNARRIQVYLLGQVRQPGTYVALAGTTAVSLIQTSGALVTAPITVNFDEMQVAHPYFKSLTSGAGRWAEVWRDGERVGNVDLAQVAIRGRAEGDIMLEDADAVFIPANSNPVVVRGGVSRPGTYELKNNDTILDLIAQAGGYRSMLLLSGVQVERRNPPGSETETSLYDLDFTDPAFSARDFQFESGDLIRVPEVKDQVYVLGAVWGPKAIDYHEGWTLLDYIAECGGPVAPTDISAIQIVGFPMSDQQTHVEFDLKSLVLGEDVVNVEIEPGDLIWVPWDNQPFYGTGLTNAIATILGQTLGILRIIKDIG
jgi:protein involved in polysaccharide export with SLBB domain